MLQFQGNGQLLMQTEIRRKWVLIKLGRNLCTVMNLSGNYSLVKWCDLCPYKKRKPTYETTSWEGRYLQSSFTKLGLVLEPQAIILWKTT